MLNNAYRCGFLSVFVVLAVFSGVVINGCSEGTSLPPGSNIVATITMSNTTIPTSGVKKEVTIMVLNKNDQTPKADIKVFLVSDRNAGGTTVDEIDQPNGNTNADGVASAFIGSTTEGQGTLSVRLNSAEGEQICGVFAANGSCETFAELAVTFCPAGQELCGVPAGCVDVATSLEHCGGCNAACAFDNATAICDNGICSMGACDTNWADCENGDTDGCEQDITGVVDDCDGIDNDCDGTTDEDPVTCTNDLCLLNGTCVNGGCSGDLKIGETIANGGCNDEDSCTLDTCDPADGSCSNTIDDGGPCNPGDVCQVGTCNAAGVCIGADKVFIPVALGGCDDEETCTEDSCNPADGTCDYTALDGNVCEDGDFCTINDTCDVNGVCVVDSKLALTVAQGGCIDGDICTDDTCNSLDGLCAWPFNTAPCPDGDGNLCTINDTCDGAGACVGTDKTLVATPAGCDDQDVCTTDGCDPGDGSCGYAFNTEACDDSNLCTLNDVCNGAGLCAGTLKVDILVADNGCDDSDTCTTDSCDPANGNCGSQYNTEDCSDGQVCTINDVCDGAGHCIGEERADILVADGGCDDEVPCTVDSCNPATGLCENLDKDCSAFDDVCVEGVCNATSGDCETNPINEGNGCTVGSCTGGTCTSGVCDGCACTVDGDCDDGQECTTDSCPALSCVWTDVGQGTGCTDDDDCTINDACDGLGHCFGEDKTTVLVANGGCDDGELCTDDTCTGGVCGYANNSNPCDDMVNCTASDMCSGGTCQGTPNDLFCDDSDPCNADICTLGVGCEYSQSTVDDINSSVMVSSSCLTLGAGGKATVVVDLLNNFGQPFAGAQVDILVTGDPITWIEGSVQESATKPGTFYRSFDAPATGVSTTFTVEASCDSNPVALQQQASVNYQDGRDPASGPGTGGCAAPADGNLRVLVVAAEDNAPIAGANVMLGLSDGTPLYLSVDNYLVLDPATGSNVTTTDANGYAYFSDLGTILDGPFSVTAGQATGAAVDRAYFTFDSVEVADLIVPLSLSAPNEVPVEFTNGSGSGFVVTPDEFDLQAGLVLREMNLDKLTVLKSDDLLASDHCVNIGMEVALPGNLYGPPQSVAFTPMPEIRWEATVKQNERLHMVMGQLPSVLDLLPPAVICGKSDLFEPLRVAPYATTMGILGFVPAADTVQDEDGYSVQLEHQFPRTLTINTTNTPQYMDLIGAVLGDYDGGNGNGGSYLNGFALKLYTLAGIDTIDVNFSADSSDQNVPDANLNYYAAAIGLFFDPGENRPVGSRPDLTGEGATSVAFWREDATGGAPFSGLADATWDVEFFLNSAKVKVDATSKDFVWDDTAIDLGAGVIKAPHFSMHEIHKVSKTYRDVALACAASATELDVIEENTEVYWQIWRPYGLTCTDTTGTEGTPSAKECMTLPTLPAGWPRAGAVAATGKLDGLPERNGSGNYCADVSECAITGDECVFFGQRCAQQSTKRCTSDATCNETDPCGLAGDTCSSERRDCMALSGSNYYTQEFLWTLRLSHLGMLASFDATDFSLSERVTSLTHESTNSLKLAQ